jgi:Raf kinase inhibitor-like YbhB/YbcL family protein
MHAVLDIESPAFNNNGLIPQKYTSISPELIVKKIPGHAKSLALIMENTGSPEGNFVHWLVWNIPPRTVISENTTPGSQGLNGKGQNAYLGPHINPGAYYLFRFFALDEILDLPVNTRKEDLIIAIQKHLIASGLLVGRFE